MARCLVFLKGWRFEILSCELSALKKTQKSLTRL